VIDSFIRYEGKWNPTNGGGPKGSGKLMYLDASKYVGDLFVYI
jgi:hypothetical protein